VPERRSALFRWIGWFAAVNGGLFALVGVRYLLLYPLPADAVGTVYAILAFIGQCALLAALPLFLTLTPIVLVLPRRRVVMAAGVIVASVGLSLLFLDTNVFAEHRFHLDLLIARLFDWSTWLLTAVVFVTLLVFQSILAGIVWRRLAAAAGPLAGRWIAASLAGCWLAGTAIHIWGDAVAYTPVTQFTRYLPLYYPLHAKRDLARLGLVDPERVRQRRMLRGNAADVGGQLQYPLSPLDCGGASEPLLNLLIVMIDGLRPDAIDADLTPELAGLAGSSLRFDQHYSGGNSSRMGLFSFFYGLPSSYWQSFYDLQVPPVLMGQIRQRGYELALFSAIGFGSPALIDRTVFAGVANLPDEERSLSAIERNRAVTRDWLRWLARRSPGSPFFALLYYDPPAGHMPDREGAPLPMDERFAANREAHQRWRQYRLAQRLVDGELGQVLASLREQELLDETVVIVTSDHGYEFDDNGLGYIGHASNFSPVQLRSTLMMLWPGRAAASFDHRTSHHDIPVTLLGNLLGCANPPSDYSVGRDLFAGESWTWIMAGSYNARAIVEPDQVIVSNPGGLVEILGPDYRPAESPRLDAALIEESMREMRRFYR
jgi:membrane-anchored protein YejM (alkaline phosphatase superfamily)